MQCTQLPILMVSLTECECAKEGSAGQCDANGKCTCNENVAGDKCTECQEFYYGYPNCQGLCDWKNLKITSSHFSVPDCKCDPEGSITLQCDTNGQCTCQDGYEGLQCQISSISIFALNFHFVCNLGRHLISQKSCDRSIFSLHVLNVWNKSTVILAYNTRKNVLGPVSVMSRVYGEVA